VHEDGRRVTDEGYGGRLGGSRESRDQSDGPSSKTSFVQFPETLVGGNFSK
jgi:hypothetical protein